MNPIVEAGARKRVVVIGAGLAGTAAAIRLAAGGHQVDLVDPNAHLGGKMNVWESGGYRFDMGPTIITMPEILDRLFASVGRSSRDYLEMVRLDPQWRCFYADGTVLDLREDVERMCGELARLSPRDADAYPRFLEYARGMFEISDEYFFWKPYGGMVDLLREYGVMNPAALRLGNRIQPFSSFHSVVTRHFKDPRVVQLFDHFMQYVGSSPFMAPAILALIAWVQMGQGVWYPMGGTGSIARALERLAAEFGVRERRGELVEEILLEGRRVTGVRLRGGERIPADVVVSNCDVIRTYDELIPHPKTAQILRSERRRFEPACSGVVLYLGCDRTWPQLAHHDFFFSEDPDREFEDIYERKVPAGDMSIYLAVPSLTDPGVAPPGHTALYVLVHTPYMTGGVDWATEGPRYRDAILGRLEQRGLTGLRESIRVERMLTPAEIERLYRSTGGSIYGLLTQKGLTSAFKPGNRCPHFPGLYFAGGSVNPGAGVPMVLMSGQTAAACVLEDLGEPALMAAATA
ncbi:MAG: phytoene desaturase [Armatimonadetes bacterium]|nr:phytoene desaturase [Armatimonadota bacterium]